MIPGGYEVEFETGQVDVTNADDVSFKVNGAEIGTTLYYSISASRGTIVQGTATVVSGSFTVTGVDLSNLPDGELTLSFYLEDEAGNKGEVASSQIVKVTRNIVAVTPLETIYVPIRTEYAQVSLPSTVEVTYSTNEKAFISVTGLRLSIWTFIR